LAWDLFFVHYHLKNGVPDSLVGVVSRFLFLSKDVNARMTGVLGSGCYNGSGGQSLLLGVGPLGSRGMDGWMDGWVVLGRYEGREGSGCGDDG
jgi:hypothetical protein